MPATSTRTIELGPGRSVEVTLAEAEAGTGRTALVLHGGGPATVQGIAAHLSGAMVSSPRSTPAGTAPRARDGSPPSATWPPAYLRLLRDEGHRDVLVSARPSAAGSAPRWPRATTPG